MKVKNFSFSKLARYNHPAILLFRGIELKILSQILSRYKIKSPSMDLGSGDGYISSLVFKETFTYGLDNNEAGDTKIAIKLKRYKKILIESAEKMSLKTNSLNFVFSNSVIEHIPRNDLVLNEVGRVLKKGGYFCFTCPSSFFTEYLTKQYGSGYSQIRNKHLNHYHLLSHSQWKKRLANENLKLIEYKYYMTEDDLLFWDKLVWVNKILFFLFPLRSLLMSALFSKSVQKRVSLSTVSQSEGANILIVAQKI